jgi:inner membrane protein
LLKAGLDSLTQIVLGAAVGEAVAGKKAGNKAVLWGGIMGFLPDVDVAANYFMSTVDAIAFHRSVTHSILFALVTAPVFGWALDRLYRRKTAARWHDWTLLVFLAFFTHALLDCFTTWGTQLFWPFSNYRVAFKSIFVIDPLYTLPLLICLVWLIQLPKQSNKRRRLNAIGLGLSSFYLLVTLVAKVQVNQVFKASMERQGIDVVNFESKPSPFNIILWAATAETREGYFMGYYSFFDDDKNIDFHFFPKNHQALRTYLHHPDVQKLKAITDGWYTVDSSDNGVVLNDLRFGQRTGWETGSGNFVFAYHIHGNGSNVRIDEVERDFREGKEMLAPLWNRIWGRKTTAGR